MNPLETTTTSRTFDTTAVLPGLAETWHYQSGAIGREIGRSHDFTFRGDLVAVIANGDQRELAVLDIKTGEELWITGIPGPATILNFEEDRLTWASYDTVGVHSAHGMPLWEHTFTSAQWPSQAIVMSGMTVVALDPTMEGDADPPLMVQLDEAGTVAWSVTLAGARPDEDLQWGELVSADDGVVVQTTDAVYKLDWNSGDQLWRVPFPEAVVETFGTTGLTYTGGVVYAADPAGEFSGREGGEVLAVDAVSGKTRMILEVGRDPRVVGIVEDWLVYTDERGVHGINTATADTWTTDMPNPVAIIDSDRVVALSPDRLMVIDPNGQTVSEIAVLITAPQPKPVILGETVIVPGWQETVAIDLDSGQTITTWPGNSLSNVVPIDDGRALLGVPGDGLHLLTMP